MTDRAHALRQAQAEAYGAEDWTRYFALSAELAEAAPAYGRSYERWSHAVFDALHRHMPDLRFLQVGAMDGKMFDPIYPFVKRHGWRGVVLEPLADMFATLVRHYADASGVVAVQAALTERDGEGEMARVPQAAVDAGAVPGWAQGLGSFFPERNALGGVGCDPELADAIARHRTTERVRCVTLATLAAEQDLPRIDLLQVDAEGYEAEILRQVLDAGYRPRVIQLEHWALAPDERGAVLGRLGIGGYRLRMSESDVLAVEPTLMAAIDAENGYGA